MKTSSKCIHIWPEDISVVNGIVTVNFTIESQEIPRTLLWYRLPDQYESDITRTCDPLVVGILFKAMRTSSDIIVHGTASPSLLVNLGEFNAAWSDWLPDRFSNINIYAEEEKEGSQADTSAHVAAFSGGVDGAFTIWRHRTGQGVNRQRNIQAGLLVHGFDIPLGWEEDFNNAYRKSRIMLKSVGLDLIPVKTNLEIMWHDWLDVHHARTAILASCLMLLQRKFSAGIIGSSFPYNHLILPMHSNPITDRFLSSDSFKIIHDSAEFSRFEKLRYLLNWSDALKYLRVCERNDHRDSNCCRCEKCVRTILSYRILGIGLPECFDNDVSDGEILKLVYPRETPLYYFKEVIQEAKKASISEPWVRALEFSLLINRVGYKAKQVTTFRNLYQFASRNP
ncbi:hypothetical protein ACFLUA_03375 [Chloroflexota bacterium]